MRKKKLVPHLGKIIPWLVIFATVFVTAFRTAPTPTTAYPAALPNVGSATVDVQVGTLTAGTPGSVTYLVTVTSATDQAFDATLSAAGLPAGATASFSPALLSWPGGAGTAGTTQTATLTITTDGSEAAGATTFTVDATAAPSGTVILPGTGNLPDMASGNGTLTIQPPVQNQTITFAPLPDKSFGDPAFTVVATATSGLPVSFTATGNCTVTSNLVHLDVTGSALFPGSGLFPVGTCTITASQAGDANYAPAPDVSQTFSISQGTQTITFNPIPDKSFGDPDFTVVATATSGLPVSFTATGNCTVTGNLVHLDVTGSALFLGTVQLPFGACTITASQAGDANYAPAPDVSQSFNIGLGGQTIIFNPIPEKVFGDLDFTVVATATSGLTVTFTAANNCTITDTLVHLTGIGSCTIAAHQDGDANYNPAPVVTQTFAITRAQTDLAIVKTVDNPTPTDGGTVVFTITVSNNGPQPTAGITVTDLITGGLTYVGDTGQGVYSSTTGLWLIDRMASGISATLKITATVNPNTDGEIITNTATITGTAVDIDPLNNSAHAVIRVGINDLCATIGTITLPGGTFTTWGYVPGDCTDGTPAQLPGPQLDFTVGETVTLTLHNNLSEPTALLFKGQAMIPDVTGVAPGASKVYSFIATQPGTYLYEAGLLAGAQYQIPMGMYGAFIVKPATAGQAYNAASTAYDDEAVLILSDIDPALNNSANPAAFDIRTYEPKYFMINGKVYPNTDDIPTAAGNRVLLRYINGGMLPYSMALLGLNQVVIATDGSPYTHNRHAVAETMAPGQTTDTLVNIPASTLDGTRYPLYNSNFYFHNNTTPGANGYGGMLTFLTVSGNLPAGDLVGPQVNSLTVSPTAVDAVISDAGRGDSGIVAAEFFIDTTGSDGSGMALALTTGAGPSIVNANGIISPPLAGEHTVYVHGQDAAGNWGAFRSVTITGETVGPNSTSVSLSHNPNNGTMDMALRGTGNDTATGGNAVIAAEFTIDGGGATAAVVSPPGAVVAGLSATIPASTLGALGEGTHTLAVRSQDSQNNWGAATAFDLVIDKTGPGTSGIALSPNPNNGQQPVNISVFAVRVTANFADGASNIVAAEGFIDAVGNNGQGFIFLPSDGLFNASSETGYSDIPLTTVNLLSPGNHTIYVHGKDAAGNWGPVSTANLFIDKGQPTVSAATASPNPTLGAASVTLTATATDAEGAITTAEWFVGIDPGNGNGTPMSITGAGPYNLSAAISVSTWANADYTLYVRVKDSAGNWSQAATTILVVNTPPPPVFAPTLNFSTLGNTTVPGVAGTADNADVYNWDGVAFSRLIDATGLGMLGGANVDGLVWNSPTDFYVSLSGNWNIPGVGIAHDEDIIHYDGAAWSIAFDLTPTGMTSARRDIDAFDIVGGVLYFSTRGAINPPGVQGVPDNSDIYRWDGQTYTRIWDATANGVRRNVNVDGLTFIDDAHFYLSLDRNTQITGLAGTIQDEDVIYYNSGNWSVYFDGTANGLGTSGNLDIDALDLP